MRRGEIERRGKKKERAAGEVKGSEDLCVFGFGKKRRYDFSPWVGLNKDDTNGFNSLNYYILPSNTITLIGLSSMG